MLRFLRCFDFDVRVQHRSIPPKGRCDAAPIHANRESCAPILVAAFHGTTSDPVLSGKPLLTAAEHQPFYFCPVNPWHWSLSTRSFSRGSCVAAAPRAHHPERRPGDCDEARDHPGVRQAPRAPGEGGQRLRLLRSSRQVAGRSERSGEERRGAPVATQEGQRSKCNCYHGLYSSFLRFFLIMYYICT